MSRPRRHLLLAVALAAVGAGLFAARVPLLAWFTGHEADLRPPPHQPGSAATFHFDAETRQALQVVYAGYEQVRTKLAADDAQGLRELAAALAAALDAVPVRAPMLPAVLNRSLEASAAAARDLAREPDLERARHLFGRISEGLVAVALEAPDLVEGWTLFECPMARGYQRWLQPEPQLSNPYMGKRMPRCGSTLSLADEAKARRAPAAGVDGVAYFTCPMHPGVKQATAGACPLCGMDLVPVSRGDVTSGVVTVDEGRRQRLGVTVAPVREAPFTVTLRAAGEVAWDERSLVDVSVRAAGWVRGLQVETTGQRVRQGQVLFTLTSPELFAAQQEYLLALRSAGQDAQSPLARAAGQRLRLWGLDDAQLAALVKAGEAQEDLPVRAPASGVVLEKDVVEGAAVTPGQRLYRIASVDRVWVEAQVYEADLPHVAVGAKATVTLPFLPGQALPGTVAYVYPALQGATRTGRLRLELDNKQGLLKPQMYADVAFRLERGVKLTVPAAAVLYTGPRRLVFVDLGEGRLQPREVHLGQRGDEGYEVLSGLVAGERVVTSGTFLVAAESRLRSATGYWGDGVDGGAEAPHAP